MTDKATVGRIVHFYDEGLRDSHTKRDETTGIGGINLNGQGAGPYPALVIQAFDGPYVNLLVHAYGGDWREGSVHEKFENDDQRYWVWPPRA